MPRTRKQTAPARLGRQTPTAAVVLPYTKTFGQDAIDLYNSTGRIAQQWQELLLYDILARNEEDLWVHTKFGYAVPRRNGKNEIAANLPSGVSRLVKRAGADTSLRNAARDGAEWAWVPHGDTCPFCITLASNGWQNASDKVLKGGHAQHVHANCDCEFAIRFDHRTTVAGYDPDKYLAQYNAAGGDINAMRRIDYAARKDAINAQKRAAYAVKNALPKIQNFNPLPENQVVDVLRKEAQPWIDKLSAAEQDAIQKYTYNPGDQRPNRFFERINRMLRGDSEEDAHLRMYAERISDALKRSPLEHDVLCYRAMEFNPFDGMQVGDIVCPGQFYSTSVVKSGSLKKDFLITICARSGSLAGYVEPLSKFKEQRELLFDKDTLYRVLLSKEKEVVLEVILP